MTNDASPQTDRAVRVLLAAFRDDDVMTWLTTDVSARLFEFVVTESAAAGGLDVLDDTAVAVWFPSPAPDAGEPPPGLPDRLRAFLETTAARHPVDRPHSYLQFLGVHPAHQGRGTGSALLARGLARADAAGLPAYLEATSPQNRGLYERHGFAPFGAPIVLPDGPTIWPMWREPLAPPSNPANE
ncbi:GNAT family N-acetyltransferase [Actinomadura sp. WAC 06369]|uniref:GNAT family N-acetyltransferase n=1 Tax=Actinomadura sp. WAC 06369 TaxID=2203193 RepID=UPI000F785871|nr:GNAT family N-acetyltransferase [Actinomadura sp. WAC 06369]RSN51802.1 GNAT family N-acetyltransferase [Actinomadura sp. WAC 06369]